MKHAQTHKPRLCPRGSGMTQLLRLLKNGHVCVLCGGTGGSGCPDRPRRRAPGTVACRAACQDSCAGLSPTLPESPCPSALGMGAEPKATNQAGDPPIPAAGQALSQEQHARDVTSAAVVTRLGWLVFCKFQLISLGFSDKMD